VKTYCDTTRMRSFDLPRLIVNRLSVMSRVARRDRSVGGVRLDLMLRHNYTLKIRSVFLERRHR